MKHAGIRGAFRALRGKQGGQTLVLAGLMMFGVTLFAAFAIDTAFWYQNRHQDQVAADAASLAAAQCLADAGTGKTCTSGTDTTDAITVAQKIASDNGVTLPPSDITFTPPSSPTSVSVTAPSQAPSFFANVAGIKRPAVQASATAAFTAGTSLTPCTTTEQSAGECDAIFAAGTCTLGYGIDFTASFTHADMIGAIISDGSLQFSNGDSSTVTGSDEYGPTSNGCGPSSYTNSLTNSTLPTAQQLPNALSYPETWGSGGNETTPPCTYTAGGTMPPGDDGWTDGTNITDGPVNSATIPSGVYCAPNGTIEFFNINNDDTTYFTLIAKTVVIDSMNGGALAPCTSTQNPNCPATNPLLIYQTGSSTLTLEDLSGMSLNGTIFAPSATIGIDSFDQSPNSVGFIEGLNVLETTSMNDEDHFTGDGPLASSSGTSSPPMLTQ